MSAENEEGLQRVIPIYLIKDRKIGGVGRVKRWLSVDEIEQIFKEGLEHEGAGVEVSLTMPDGSENLLTFNEGETQDKESITVEHFLKETPGNGN